MTVPSLPESPEGEAIELLRDLYAWASRMPDAGLHDGDPRRQWWFDGTEARHAAGRFLNPSAWPPVAPPVSREAQ